MEQDKIINKKYVEEMLETDEKKFSEAEKTGRLDWTSFQRLVLHDLCLDKQFIANGVIGDCKLPDIVDAMRHPWSEWRLLVKVSDELMRISPHYYRLNMMFSNMALFDWGIDLYGVKESADVSRIKERYLSLSSKLEDMHLKYEFGKIMKYLPYQDVFCGLLMENQNDFFIQHVNYRLCKLYHVQDGVFNFAIDLSRIDPVYIDAYPPYVKEAHNAYKKNNANRWYEPPADKQICIKWNTQWLYPFPFLLGLIRDILDLDTYKKLKLQSARTDNYKAIAVKVPIDESQIDKPLLTPDSLAVFAQINKANMSEDIGLLHTVGGDAKPINFKDSANTRNNVSDAGDEIYNSSGVSIELFNGSSSGTAVTFSVENDSGFIYSIYRQFEQWTNRFIKIRKYNTALFKFKFYLLDTTIFNRDKVVTRYKDACTLGVTVIDKLVASLGMTPSKLLGSYILHKDIFDFRNNFKPLSSTYNSSDTAGEVGRPTNEEIGETLDVQGEVTADNDSNMDR